MNIPLDFLCMYRSNAQSEKQNTSREDRDNQLVISHEHILVRVMFTLQLLFRRKTQCLHIQANLQGIRTAISADSMLPAMIIDSRPSLY